MSKVKLRQVWRETNDGNGDIKVLGLQVWRPAEGWEHEDIVKKGGYWEEVPISTSDDPYDGEYDL